MKATNTGKFKRDTWEGGQGNEAHNLEDQNELVGCEKEFVLSEVLEVEVICCVV